MATSDDGERVHPETVEEWRAWLDANHEVSPGVWLVSWKKHTGRPTVGYEEAVTEALAVGWVDSKGKRLDDDRTMLWLTRRRPTSGWSRPNKRRIELLLAEDRMGPAGQAAIDEAKQNGTWSLLDDVENLVVPDDLGAEFDTAPRRSGGVGRVPAVGEAQHPGVDRHREAAGDAESPHRRDRREGRSRRAGSPVTLIDHSCALRTTRSWRSELPRVSFAKYTAMTVMTDARAT